MRIITRIVIGATLLLVAALACSVSAGGWAVATLDTMPKFVAGQETTVGFTLRQHGNTLLAGIRPSQITFHNVESGQRLTFPAPDEGSQGHYAARVSLPQAGTWEWSISAFGDHPMPPVTATVTASALPVALTAPPDDRAVPLPLAALGMGLLAALAIFSFVLGWRWRGQPSPLQPNREPQTAAR